VNRLLRMQSDLESCQHVRACSEDTWVRILNTDVLKFDCMSEKGITAHLANYRDGLNILGEAIGYSKCRICNDSFFWKLCAGVSSNGHGLVLGCQECIENASLEVLKNLIDEHPSCPSKEDKLLYYSVVEKGIFDIMSLSYKIFEKSPAKIMVSESIGCDDEGDFLSPWKTIKAALEVVGDLDVIFISEGDYEEEIEIENHVVIEAEDGVSIKSLTLIGQDAQLEFTENSYPVTFQVLKGLPGRDC